MGGNKLMNSSTSQPLIYPLKKNTLAVYSYKIDLEIS